MSASPSFGLKKFPVPKAYPCRPSSTATSPSGSTSLLGSPLLADSTASNRTPPLQDENKQKRRDQRNIENAIWQNLTRTHSDDMQSLLFEALSEWRLDALCLCGDQDRGLLDTH